MFDSFFFATFNILSFLFVCFFSLLCGKGTFFSEPTYLVILNFLYFYRHVLIEEINYSVKENIKSKKFLTINCNMRARLVENSGKEEAHSTKEARCELPC